MKLYTSIVCISQLDINYISTVLYTFLLIINVAMHLNIHPHEFLKSYEGNCCFINDC